MLKAVKILALVSGTAVVSSGLTLFVLFKAVDNHSGGEMTRDIKKALGEGREDWKNRKK